MGTKIIKINGHLFAEDNERGLVHLYPLKTVQQVIKEIAVGDEVFWIDPCYWRGDEHTSRWAKVTDIRGEIIELDNGTEVTINELYW